MNAAIVHTLGAPPSFGDFPEPEPAENETLITVKAAPLSPIVRALASGRHYASGRAAGFVAGVDGVGIDQAGRRVYFLFPRAPFGSMATKTVAMNALVVPVPDNLKDEQAAALATAGLASWVALSRRAPIAKGATVLINGATGAAGGMAIQTARHFGASKLIAVGRNERHLAELDVDVKVPLNDQADELLRAEFAKGIDVVLDFLWGEPASRILNAVPRAGRSGEPRLRYVQIGTAAGDEIPIRGDLLRSTGVELLGSGIGSVAVQDLVQGARELLSAAGAAAFSAPFQCVPLSKIGEAWTAPSGPRCILVP